jgi:hypothetical protein
MIVDFIFPPSRNDRLPENTLAVDFSSISSITHHVLQLRRPINTAYAPCYGFLTASKKTSPGATSANIYSDSRPTSSFAQADSKGNTHIRLELSYKGAFEFPEQGCYRPRLSSDRKHASRVTLIAGISQRVGSRQAQIFVEFFLTCELIWSFQLL